MEDKYLKALEFDKVLEELSNYASTSLGKERCLDSDVFSDFEKIEEQLLYK